METKELDFKGIVVNGFVMLFANIFMSLLSIAMFVYSIILLDEKKCYTWGGILLAASILLLLFTLIMWCGFLMVEPNTARVTTWFGKYSGTSYPGWR